MYKSKKLILLFIFSITLLTLQGCGGITDYFEELFDPTLMIVRGTETISGDGEVLTIVPGTTVRLKGSGRYLLGDGYAEVGQLILTNGAKLIANGETERIIFETGDGGYGITFEEDSSTNSVITYCELKELSISIKNYFINIKNNKFTETTIGCYLNSSPLIEYNIFDGESLLLTGIGISAEWGGDDSVSPIIRYNIIKYFYYGLTFYKSNTPIIESNNITNCESYAVNWSTNGIISNNYIADCNGKVSVDLTGEQSSGVKYQNPRSTPVEDAGCDW